MIVVVATAVGMLSVKLFGGELKRLASVELHHLWLIWATLVVQTLIFQLPASVLSDVWYQVIHLATYVASFVFLWMNRHIPGALIIGVGAACNAAAIAANGGVMPASPAAWARAGLPVFQNFENSNVVADARLAMLGDIFAIPASWPLSNVFSIGDVLIVLGGTYFAHVCCRRPSRSPRASTAGEPSAHRDGVGTFAAIERTESLGSTPESVPETPTS